MGIKDLLSRPHAIISHGKPAFPDSNVLNLSIEQFRTYLAVLSPQVIELQGMDEASFLVSLDFPDEDQVIIGNENSGQYDLSGGEIVELLILQLTSLAAASGEEAILLSTGRYHQLHFVSGKDRGRLIIGEGTEVFNAPPKGDYSIYQNEYFRHGLTSDSKKLDIKLQSEKTGLYSVLSLFNESGAPADFWNRLQKQDTGVSVFEVEGAFYVRVSGNTYRIKQDRYRVLVSIRDNPGITKPELEERHEIVLGSVSAPERWTFDFFKTLTKKGVSPTMLIKKDGDWKTGRLFLQG